MLHKNSSIIQNELLTQRI